MNRPQNFMLHTDVLLLAFQEANKTDVWGDAFDMLKEMDGKYE